MSKNCKPPGIIYLVKFFLHHVECCAYKALGALKVFLFLLTGECKKGEAFPGRAYPRFSVVPWHCAGRLLRQEQSCCSFLLLNSVREAESEIICISELLLE